MDDVVVNKDLAMHLVRVHRLGIPQDSREAFDLLAAAGLYPKESADRLRRMVGFRNVAVHDYQALSLDIVREIIRSHLDDLAAFAANQMVVVLRQVLCQLEPAVVVSAGDAAHDSGLDERGDVAVGA